MSDSVLAAIEHELFGTPPASPAAEGAEPSILKSPLIIDASVNVTAHLPALKRAGVDTVFRYLDPIGPGSEKNIKPPEVEAIAGAGLRLALFSEGWGDFAHGGISAGAGTRDAEYALSRLSVLGMPGAPQLAAIYFAVDTDASAGQITKLVLPYFAAIAELARDHFFVGVYGSGAVCEAVIGAGHAAYACLSCSLGWSGSRAYLASRKWTLRQHVPGRVAGLDCDVDEAQGAFGDFVPFATAPAAQAQP